MIASRRSSTSGDAASTASAGPRAAEEAAPGPRTRLGTRPGVALGLNLCILLTALTVLTLAAEFVARWAFRDVTTTADNRSYFAMRWRNANVRFNSWHFREQPFTLTKPQGTYRIAIVGDSLTEGQGVGENARFSNVLGKRLNAWQEGYQVLNFGRAGAETVDQLQILTDVVLSAQPDFVLLQWYVNDVEGRDKSGRPRPWRLIPSDVVARALRPTSALFFLLNQQWGTIQQKLGLLRSYEDYMIERFGDPHSPSSRAAQEALEQLIGICNQRGVPLGIVLFGWSYAHHSRLDFLVERVLTLCRREGLLCVDTRSTFGAHDQGTRLWANRLDPHPGVLAHDLVAEQLIQAFGDVWQRARLSRGDSTPVGG